MITDAQREKAVTDCDRILQLCRETQQRLENVRRIFKNLAEGRDTMDGVVEP